MFITSKIDPQGVSGGLNPADLLSDIMEEIMPNKQVYGYIRVFTDRQSGKGYRLETQSDAIKKHCDDNSYELIEIFEDPVTVTAESSGADLISKRKGLLQLLSQLDSVNAIVVINTSCLWHSDIANVLIRREVKRKYGEVISIEQPSYSIYKENPDEVLIRGMSQLLDEYERVSVALKLAKGRAIKASKGDKPAGVTPYGYKYSDDKKSVEVNEPESVIVKRIFKLAQYGKTIQQIVNALNTEGITTRQGKAWTRGTIHGMLRNDFYTGVLTHQQERMNGNHMAIISKIQFGKVRKQLERRNKRKI